MHRFTYSMGTWTQGNSAPDWNEDEEFEDYLRRIGYSPVKNRIGHEFGSVIDIFTSSDENKFIASVSPDGSNVYEVFIQDFPSLMLFLKDFGSVFSLLAIEAHQSETRDMMEKLFNVYHGHAAHDICKQCAPSEWRLRQEKKHGA